MKKSLLLMGAMLLATSGTFAQKLVPAKSPAKKANTEVKAAKADYSKFVKLPALMAPVEMSEKPEVQATASRNKAPRRVMDDGVWYQRPVGSFYYSGSNSSNYWSYLYLPAFSKFTWANKATNKAEATWAYLWQGEIDAELEGNADNDLEVTVPKIDNGYISTYYIPQMTVGKTTYTFGENFPNTPTVALLNGDSLEMVTDVNLSNGYYTGFQNGGSFGNRKGQVEIDGEMVDVIRDAIYEFYHKPIKPICLNDVFFRVIGYDTKEIMNDDTQMKLTIRKVNEDDEIGDVIAEIPFGLEDATYVEQDGADCFAAFLISQKEQDAFGTEYEVPIIIEDAFVIIISGFEQPDVNFSIYMSGDNKDIETDSFLKDGLLIPTMGSFVRADNGEPVDGLYYCQAITKERSDQYNEEDGDNYDWTRHYNAVFHLDLMQDVVRVYDGFETMYAENEGGTVFAVVEEENEETGEMENVAYGTLQYESTLPRLSTWEGMEGEDNYEFVDLPDWLTVTDYNDSYYDQYNVTLAALEAQPLPADMKGRKAEIRIVSERGADSGIITIIQGEVDEEQPFEPFAFDGADGKYYLANIASDKFWGAGNSWGTQASLLKHPEYVTLLKQPDGTYFLESQVSNGGTNYYFNGDFMDNGSPVALTITAVGLIGYGDEEETQPIYAYTIANGENFFGYDGETTVLGKNLAADSENALWIIAPEQEAIASLAHATEEDPMDATFLILDPNFSRNNRNKSAWTMEASNQNLGGGANENMCAESWQSAFTLSQKISVPNGKYILNAQAALTDYSGAYDGTDYPVIYANEKSSAFNSMDESDRATNMATLSASFTAGKYQVEPIEVIVFDGTLTVGARGTRTDTWCIWDNFELTYYGPVEIDMQLYIDAYLKALAAANEAATKQMSQAAKAALDAVIAANSQVDQTSVPALMAATTALNDAVAAAQTSIKSYEILAAGVVADNSLENWTCTNTNTFHINTWSVEGNEGNDPSGMITPFIENWVGQPGPLGEGQVYYTLAGIDPGQYFAQALVRVYSESGSEPAGATFFVGDERTDIAANGNAFTYNNMLGVYGTFGGTATVGEDGVLKFGLDIAAPTFNWVAIKNVKIQAGIPEAIKNVDTKQTEENTIYNLNGQKVKSAQKGLYIVNGKKVVIK